MGEEREEREEGEEGEEGGVSRPARCVTSPPSVPMATMRNTAVRTHIHPLFTCEDSDWLMNKLIMLDMMR